MNKGFFLSLSALVFLVFAVSSVTQHLSSIRENEMYYADLMSLLSYQTVFSNFNSGSMSASLGAIGKFALFKMANHTAYHPMKDTGDDAKNMENAGLVFQSLINTGTSDSSLFTDSKGISYSEGEMGYTLSGFASLVDAVLAPIGYNANALEFADTKMEMKTPHSVLVTSDVIVDVSDSLGRSAYRVVYKGLEAEISIEGLPDPMLNRYLIDEEHPGGAQNYSWFLFRHNGDAVVDTFDSTVSSTSFEEAEAGQGWFYGPLVSVAQANAGTPASPELYILYGDFSDILNTENWTYYGAYIITSSITEMDGDCGAQDDEDPETVFNPVVYSGACVASEDPDGTHAEKPFLVISDFAPSDISTGNFFDDTGGQTAYFDTGKDQYRTGPAAKGISQITLYGIEGLRDQFICAYYYKSISGPNFFQRMFQNAQKMSDEDYGITTILVEEEFLGPGNAYIDWSSVDFEFISTYERTSAPQNLNIIKGMPGCKNRLMCATGTVIRRVIMSEDVKDEFGIQDYLACGINDRLCTEVE
jgi:hypothetical protein